MLKSRSVPFPENVPPTPKQALARVGSLLKFSPSAAPLLRRQLTRESGRALEMLSHAIEYLADEYAADTEPKATAGRVDPRVEAIQVLKTLNRGVYYSGTVVQPAFRRIRRWFLGARVVGSRTL